MDITKELQDTKTKQAQIVDKINILEQQKQQLFQEALKLEGAIRLLKRLDGAKAEGVDE
uniref:Uncharacterized protein n=1 Tax=viral metagenome TaxID=1070528 RepID=A0A6M3KFN0_9ZZZZ